MTRHGALLAALAALALTPLRGGALEKAPAAPFRAEGELFLHGYGTADSSAAYDARRVVGPSVNLTRREDGSWGGDVAGQDVSLTMADRRISAAGLSLEVSRTDGRTEVAGIFFDRLFRVTLDARRLQGRFGQCSFDLARSPSGTYEGDLGCQPPHDGYPAASRASLTLVGTAADPAAPLPQLALALLAVLPG